ncbi:hypothetical protein BDV93DRAFT_225060 [Ceratobasidium sp. AG-I]|nr:hypothetical protein BDV93DRAFT_225060 [Ceratobasidium sp. AG-I]
MFPSARPRSSSSPGSRPITSIKSPLPSPSGLLPPVPTFSRTTSSGFFHPEWPQSDLELHSKLNAYIRDGGERFRDYIPSYLTNDTKRKLVDYMEQKSTQIAVSQGYIYAHKVSSKSGAEHMWIKVGCSIHPDRRFGQWRRDCPKSYFEPRGVWPNNNAPGKLTTDKKDLARMSQFKYVLEGLIKIELQDLAQESSHLQERLEPPLPSKSCSHGNIRNWTI